MLGTGSISFGGTVDGAQALTVNGTGATTFSGAVGGTTALSSLTSDAGGTLSLKSVTTSGAQSYGDAATLDGAYTTGNAAFGVTGAVTLAGATSVSGGGIAFASTLDGGHSLTVGSPTGAIDFGGAVGGIARLGALTVNGGSVTTLQGMVKAASLTTDTKGRTVVNGGLVDTTGAQSYGDTVRLGADTVLTGVTVTLAAGADAVSLGGQGLTIAGNAVLTNAFGGVQALKTLTVSGATALNGGSISTVGTQTFGGAVTLANRAETLTSGGGISFASILDGGQALALSAGAGNVTFADAVGGGIRLGALTVDTGGATRFAGTVRAESVTTDSAGTLALDGGLIDTSGGQSYGELAVLGADTVLSGGTITLGAGADSSDQGARTLTITGDAVVNGAVGANRALRGFTVTGASALNGGTVATLADQSFGGAVQLGADTTLTGGVITLQGGGDSVMVGASGLTIVGDAVLAGAFGSARELKHFSVSGATRLIGDSVLATAGGDLMFGGTIDTANRTSLSLAAIGGSIHAVGDIGGSSPLGDISIRAGGGVLFDGAVAARSVVQTVGGATTRFSKGLTADGADGISLTGASFTFDAPVTASAGALAITGFDSSGTVTFGVGANIITAKGFTQKGDRA